MTPALSTSSLLGDTTNSVLLLFGVDVIAFALQIVAPLSLLFAAIWYYLDFKVWIEFGQGNPPGMANLKGYVYFQILKYYLALIRSDNKSTEFIKDVKDRRRFLDDKVFYSATSDGYRKGGRAVMAPWILPQREQGPYNHHPAIEPKVRSLVATVANELRDEALQSGLSQSSIEMICSRLEGFGDALIVSDDCETCCHEIDTTFREFCHIHQQDLSFHIVMSPLDAAAVVHHQYGERFAFSGMKVSNGRLVNKIIPHGYTLVYTPRNEGELVVVKEIIKASARYALSG